LPDIRPFKKPNTGYPAGFSTQHFNCLVKYEINNEGFLFPYLKHKIFSIKAVTVSKRHFWEYYELVWIFFQFGRISGYFEYPASQIRYPAGRISGASLPLYKTNTLIEVEAAAA
jgi:hypothetical protein